MPHYHLCSVCVVIKELFNGTPSFSGVPACQGFVKKHVLKKDVIFSVLYQRGKLMSKIDSASNAEENTGSPWVFLFFVVLVYIAFSALLSVAMKDFWCERMENRIENQMVSERVVLS